jgi:hypothetical protein
LLLNAVKANSGSAPVTSVRTTVTDAHIEAELAAARRVKEIEERNARMRETLLHTTPAPPRGERGAEAPGQPTRVGDYPTEGGEHHLVRPKDPTTSHKSRDDIEIVEEVQNASA